MSSALLPYPLFSSHLTNIKRILNFSLQLVHPHYAPCLQVSPAFITSHVFKYVHKIIHLRQSIWLLKPVSSAQQLLDPITTPHLLNLHSLHNQSYPKQRIMMQTPHAHILEQQIISITLVLTFAMVLIFYHHLIIPHPLTMLSTSPLLHHIIITCYRLRLLYRKS